MTGGGDCPGLNAVIRGVVRVGIDRYHWEILGVEDAFSGLIDTSYRSPRGNKWLTGDDVSGILERGGTILGTSNRSDPFRYVVRDPSGKDHETDVSDRVMENWRKLKLDALVSIGGDGSMRIAKRFMDKGMNIVGVPKTIDNDLGCTDQTFGFDTAVNIATEAIDRLRTTADSHDRVMLIEVMGRDAGWIALHAGLAGGADAILLPEIPYRIEKVAAMIRERRASGKNYSILVVAEGAKPLGGDTSVLEHKAGEMPRLMGAAQRVAASLGRLIDAEMRVTVLGHLQRGGTPSSFDRILATRFGVAAAELIAQEKFGVMVALRGGEIVPVPIDEAVAANKHVDPAGQMVSAARAVGTVFAD
ncbi:MAG: ATP-dependent 6-phosphofructokinase [Sandaracinaceae bacterium]|nr:ATP-dependent 6-phosphofructokinase [Sandaracinaceae bacterium]